jgi:hypothetical protein
MAKIGAEMDFQAWRNDESYKSYHEHYLRKAGENKQAAFESAQALVNYNLNVAKGWEERVRQAQRERDREFAERKRIEFLAHAFHTVMDATSPVHSDKSGWPIEYAGKNRDLHSPDDFQGRERSRDITPPIRKLAEEYLERAYDAYMKGKEFYFNTPEGYLYPDR